MCMMYIFYVIRSIPQYVKNSATNTIMAFLGQIFTSKFLLSQQYYCKATKIRYTLNALKMHTISREFC